MTTLADRHSDDARADELRTKRTAFAAFARHGSPRVIATALTAGVGVRLLIGGWGILDLVFLAVTLLLVGVVEWCIHRYLLHAPPDSFRMRVLKTGSGHREHHLDPGHVGWLLLGTADAAIFAGMIMAGTVAWALPVTLAVGTGPAAGPIATAVVLALGALAHYEWTHLLVHTRYRPKTPYYRRLARHHRLHHFRNEEYWLGVTSNLGDRLLGTLPSNKTAVPLSDTARTLA